MMAHRMALAVFLLPVLTACATLRVESDFERGVDFSRYRSFAFLPLTTAGPSDPSLDPLDNDIVSRRIQREIQRVLETRGLALARPGEADLKVSFHVASEEKLEVRTDPYHIGFSHGLYGRHGLFGFGGGGIFAGGVYSRTYTEGALVVHLIDSSTDELVWHGWARDRLPRRGPGSERIERSVASILEQFPPVGSADNGGG